MKKNICFALILATAVLLSSCLMSRTHRLVADENNPAQNNAEVQFVSDIKDGYFYLSKWNDGDIEETLYKSKSVSSGDKAMLTVPSGNNAFTFTVRYTFSNRYSSYTYKFENIELQYLLEAGKKYTIKGRTKSLGLFKGWELFVGIYDTTQGSALLKEWKLGETD